MTSTALFQGQTPLAVRMRPTSLDEVAGQSHLLRPGSPLVLLARPDVSTGAAASVILWGPPGTGKTTLAQAIARSSGRRFVELSAVTAGVRDVREVMQEALTQRDLYGQSTILFLDEIHRFTKAQQDALLPGVENGWVVLIAATTENPSFSVISPLLSRSLLLTLQPLTDDDLGMLVDRAVADPRGLGGGVALAARGARRARAARLGRCAARADRARGGGIPRRAGRRTSPTTSDDATTTHSRSRPTTSRARWTARCCATTGRATSTTTSSARSSSRSAAPTSTPSMHYLARMIEAGEDPRFIARRLVISAAEDIGLADPQALSIAVAAADAVAVHRDAGGPHPARRGDRLSRDDREVERRLSRDRQGDRRRPRRRIRARARRTCATRTTRARSGSATARATGTRTTPRSAWSRSSTCPTTCVDRRYYEPTNHGQERDVQARLEKIRRILGGS